MPSLTRTEARQRSALITVTRMEVDLDLDRGEPDVRLARPGSLFCSAAEPGSTTFVDLLPVELRSLVLNGRPRRRRRPGRRADRAAGPAGRERPGGRRGDGLQPRRPGPAPRGRPGRRRALRLRAPVPRRRARGCSPASTSPTSRRPMPSPSPHPSPGWCSATGRRPRSAPGRWELAETLPLATYFVTVCAGPYASVRDEHDGIPLGIHARASLRSTSSGRRRRCSR